ncbi:hypothetical protein COJ93_27515 [Bacillus anthracis]|nr:hypothetical protein BAU26_21845 [Bacillus sp. N35-10-4]PEF67319.1 hypothetical protein CON33_12235 [Bacillus anthracis]PFA94942.1 hypothetical protein CN385_28015 [Bacillus anthracis]PFP32211.1 hypothetical protein COJ93_27515 [Bacillus anthracis]PFU21563.1 hypothetical protein COK80_28320 [Bacillus anthracis]
MKSRKFMVNIRAITYTGDREFIIHLGRGDHD